MTSTWVTKFSFFFSLFGSSIHCGTFQCPWRTQIVASMQKKNAVVYHPCHIYSVPNQNYQITTAQMNSGYRFLARPFLLVATYPSWGIKCSSAEFSLPGTNLWYFVGWGFPSTSTKKGGGMRWGACWVCSSRT